MHDVSDEEVDENFREKLQLHHIIALENDEFMFWRKLEYFLFTNDADAKKIMPIDIRKLNYRANDDINFDRYNINRPIIHVHGHKDPLASDNPRKANLPPLPKSTKRSRFNSVDDSKEASVSLTVEQQQLTKTHQSSR